LTNFNTPMSFNDHFKTETSKLGSFVVKKKSN
jgi:hypothetical protein